MNIDKILDTTKMDDYIANKLVLIREDNVHGSDLVVANYSKQTMYTRTWDDVTENTRGLIFNKNTGEVAARPWKKFYNHMEDKAPDLTTFGEVEVTDKMDGSLGVGFRLDDGKLRIATKGSFGSDEAKEANKMLQSYTEDIDASITPLFEIIYPGNRIVIDYKDTNELFLLGGVVMDTGEVLSPYDARLDSYSGPRTKVFQATSVGEALAMSPREGAEGIIIRDKATGRMVKVKQQDYVELHRVMTSTTNLTVWQSMYDGSIDQIIDRAPDELYDSIKSVIAGFQEQMDGIVAADKVNAQRVADHFGVAHYEDLASGVDRKAMIMVMKDMFDKRDMSSALAHILGVDDRYYTKVMKSIRPNGKNSQLLGKFSS